MSVIPVRIRAVRLSPRAAKIVEALTDAGLDTVDEMLAELAPLLCFESAEELVDAVETAAKTPTGSFARLTKRDEAIAVKVLGKFASDRVKELDALEAAVDTDNPN